MGMSIDEIIANETEIAQGFQEIIDTHIISDFFSLSLEEMYCDDTEVIEERLQRYKGFADYHNQIADIMRKYQKIREIAFPLQFCSTDKLEHEAIMKICEVLEDGSENNHHAHNT